MDSCRQQQLIDLSPSSLNHQQQWKVTAAFILLLSRFKSCTVLILRALYVRRFSISDSTTVEPTFQQHICNDWWPSLSKCEGNSLFCRVFFPSLLHFLCIWRTQDCQKPKAHSTLVNCNFVLYINCIYCI